MESTPQNTQPQGNESQRIQTCWEGQDKLASPSDFIKPVVAVQEEGDKLVLKSTFGNEPQEPNPVAPQLSLPSGGAISDLLSHLAKVFGNTDLISAAKIELACIQEELLEKPQEVYPQLDFNDVHLRMDIQEILESCSWFEDVYIQFPKDMQVDCSGCDITVSDVKGEVEVIMSQGQSEALAEQIMDFLEKRTNIIKHA